MKPVGLLAPAILCVVFPAAYAQKQAPLPRQILEAKTVYLDNQSNYAVVADQAYEELSKWGRLRVVNDKGEADLIFRLETDQSQEIASTPGVAVSNKVGNSTITTGGSQIYSSTVGFTRLTILDAKDGARLWSNTKPWSRKGGSRDLMVDFRKRIESQAVTERPIKR